MNDKLTALVDQALESILPGPKADGTYSLELFADYRDEMGNETATEILQAEHPEEKFWDTMLEWYSDAEQAELEEISKKVFDVLKDSEEISLNDVDMDDIEDAVLSMVRIELPYDHYYNQMFCTNIMLDTGDGNYDYVLNSVYPSYAGEKDDRIDPKASIVWLAKQHGFTKTELTSYLRACDDNTDSKFINSMVREVMNLTSHMNTLTFLVEMPLYDLLKLNRLIALQDRDGHNWDATQNPDCGYIVIDKNSEGGLYDPWSGAGSLLDLELEKDVRIPVKYIRSALPDGGDGYSIESVYGMSSSSWESGYVSKIHCPKKLAALAGFR